MVHKVTDGERGQEEGEGSQAGGCPLPPPALSRLLVTVDFNGSAMGGCLRLGSSLLEAEPRGPTPGFRGALSFLGPAVGSCWQSRAPGKQGPWSWRLHPLGPRKTARLWPLLSFYPDYF